MKIGICVDNNPGAFNDTLFGIFTATEIMRQCPKCEVYSIWRVKFQTWKYFDALILGGGSLLGEFDIFPFSEITKWHNRYEGKLYVLGTGYRYYPDKELLTGQHKKNLKTLFEHADRICLRGYKTLELCEQNDLCTSRVELLADAIFLAEPMVGTTREGIGFNVREEYENQKMPFDVLLPKLVKVFDAIAQKANVPITFLAPYPNDVLSNQKVNEKMHLHGVISKANTQFKYYEELTKLSFFFGMRAHTQLLAGINHIPFLPLEYHFEKMWDALSPLDLQDWIVNINNIDMDTISKLYDKRFEFLYRFFEAAAKKRFALKKFVGSLLGDIQ